MTRRSIRSGVFDRRDSGVARVVLEGVSKRYGDVVALHPTDLDVAEGEFLTLLGPSGCGKTTTLRMIAGFVEPSAGRLRFDGEDVTDTPPQKRAIGMVFQDYALFPHLSIADNIGFGLRERGAPKAQIAARVEELLDLIKLPEIRDRLPSQISGGQQQRVAFARAIAAPPRVLLMDEPLGALDLKLREAMQGELRRLQRALGITTVYVTHDQGEAMNLSDRIAVMSKGRIVQLGDARTIYDRPTNRFVADFVGKINFITGPLQGRDGDWSLLQAAGETLRAPAGPSGDSVTLAIRPEKVHASISAEIPERHNRLPGRVVSQTFNGNLCHLQVDLEGAQWTVERRPGPPEIADGAQVVLHWDPDDGVLLTG
jgi:putative spermidine/putrescine transport system ATP-binding protein